MTSGRHRNAAGKCLRHDHFFEHLYVASDSLPSQKLTIQFRPAVAGLNTGNEGLSSGEFTINLLIPEAASPQRLACRCRSRTRDRRDDRGGIETRDIHFAVKRLGRRWCGRAWEGSACNGSVACGSADWNDDVWVVALFFYLLVGALTLRGTFTLPAASTNLEMAN